MTIFFFADFVNNKLGLLTMKDETNKTADGDLKDSILGDDLDESHEES